MATLEKEKHLTEAASYSFRGPVHYYLVGTIVVPGRHSAGKVAENSTSCRQ